MLHLAYYEKIKATKPTPRMWDKIKHFTNKHSSLDYTCLCLYRDAKFYNLYSAMNGTFKPSYIKLVLRTAKLIKL